jgi:hypothetical protein
MERTAAVENDLWFLQDELNVKMRDRREHFRLFKRQRARVFGLVG